VHIVFGVKYRQRLIGPSWKDELCKYISGIISSKGHKPLIVNGYANHIHCLVGLRPSMSISDLVRDIKNNSSKFVNEKRLSSSKFAWQEGYAVFSCAASNVDLVYRYIRNQEQHHRHKSFLEEYRELIGNVRD